MARDTIGGRVVPPTITPLPLPPLHITIHTPRRIVRVELALLEWSTDEHISGLALLYLIFNLKVYPLRSPLLSFTLKRTLQVALPADTVYIRLARSHWRLAKHSLTLYPELEFCSRLAPAKHVSSALEIQPPQEALETDTFKLYSKNSPLKL